MALVVLSKVEQRLDAVRAVLAGASLTEVAAVARSVAGERACLVVAVSGRRCGRISGPIASAAVVSASGRGVGDRAGRRAAAAASAVGGEADPARVVEEPAGRDGAVPSTSTLNRILVRQGLVVQRKRKRPRESFTRWQRPGPMQLWQLDIVGGVMLVDPVTGAVREAKVVTGVDDHSRFCVIAAVVERATDQEKPGMQPAVLIGPVRPTIPLRWACHPASYALREPSSAAATCGNTRLTSRNALGGAQRFSPLNGILRTPCGPFRHVAQQH